MKPRLSHAMPCCHAMPCHRVPAEESNPPHPSYTLPLFIDDNIIAYDRLESQHQPATKLQIQQHKRTDKFDL
jgi:hypothetical protein